MKKNCIYGIIILIACNNVNKISTDFNFSYSFDYTETINTFDSTYKREYNFKDTVIYLAFTLEEKEKAYSVMMENDILTLPENFEYDNTKSCVQPASTDYLTVQIDGKKKRIQYSYSCYPKNESFAERLLNITNAIKKILETKKEIKGLPESDMIFLYLQISPPLWGGWVGLLLLQHPNFL
jgi:hypothetical protein